jgi:hypothetical protein
MTPVQMTEPASAILTRGEMDTLIDALDELANVYAYQAEHADTAKAYSVAAPKAEGLSNLAQKLRDRRGNEGEWTR